MNKYYLNKRVKKMLGVNLYPRKKTIETTVQYLDLLGPKEIMYIDLLRKEHGYQIQLKLNMI